MTHLPRIAMALLIAAVAMSACAGQSDEERCRGGGGIWKGDSCEYASR
jgi:hypothetical protein